MAEAEDDADRDRASRRYDELHDQIEHQDAYSIDHRVEEILSGLGFAEADFDRAASDVLRRPAVAADARQAAAREPRPDAPGRAVEPPRHRDHRVARELPGAAAGGDGRRQPRPLLPGQGRHQDLGAARGQDRRPTPATTPSTGGSAPRRPRSSSGRPSARRRRPPKLEAYIRKYGAGQRAKQAHDRERKLERLERERVETMRDIVGPVMGFDEVERSGDIVIEARHLSKAYDKPLFQRPERRRPARASASA